MPTAPKTYHYHFIHLTYLLYLFVMPTPYSTIHPPPTPINQPPPFPTPSTNFAPVDPPRPKLHRKRTKNRRPTGATARPVPTPPPARQSPHSTRPIRTTELRTQHPRPRSTGNRAGRDAPCRSRSPEKEGKATDPNEKSIKNEEKL